MYQIRMCLHVSSFCVVLSFSELELSSNSAVFLVASTRRAAASVTARTAVKRPSLNLVHLVWTSRHVDGLKHIEYHFEIRLTQNFG